VTNAAKKLAGRQVKWTVGFLIAGILLAILLFAGSPPSDGGVRFVGFTNVVGRRTAIFQITNGCRVSVTRYGRYSVDGFRSNQPPTGEILSTSATVRLEPFSDETLQVPAPTNQMRWRVTVAVTPLSARNRFRLWLNRAFSERFYEWIPRRLRGTPIVHWSSPWIDEQHPL
jgi:hypothetical protein